MSIPFILSIMKDEGCYITYVPHSKRASKALQEWTDFTIASSNSTLVKTALPSTMVNAIWTLVSEKVGGEGEIAEMWPVIMAPLWHSFLCS